MRAVAVSIFRAAALAVTLEIVGGLLVGFVLNEFFDHIASQFVPDAKVWMDDTHYHSDLETVHMAVKHQSHEGHWLNIVCNLPQKVLRVSVKIGSPIEIASRFDGRVRVVHQVGSGNHETLFWVFNDKESLVFAPGDMDLAQRIVRSKYFYFHGQFEPQGRPYVATFDLAYTGGAHPAIAVLTACEEPLMPTLRTPPDPYEPPSPRPQT